MAIVVISRSGLRVLDRNTGKRERITPTGNGSSFVRGVGSAAPVRPAGRRRPVRPPAVGRRVECATRGGSHGQDHPLWWFVVAAVLVAAVVVALGLLYHQIALARAGVPARTAQVRLQAGEDLRDLARRMVPHGQPAAVADPRGSAGAAS